MDQTLKIKKFGGFIFQNHWKSTTTKGVTLSKKLLKSYSDKFLTESWLDKFNLNGEIQIEEFLYQIIEKSIEIKQDKFNKISLQQKAIEKNKLFFPLSKKKSFHEQCLYLSECLTVPKNQIFEFFEKQGIDQNEDPNFDQIRKMIFLEKYENRVILCQISRLLELKGIEKIFKKQAQNIYNKEDFMSLIKEIDVPIFFKESAFYYLTNNKDYLSIKVLLFHLLFPFYSVEEIIKEFKSCIQSMGPQQLDQINKLEEVQYPDIKNKVKLKNNFTYYGFLLLSDYDKNVITDCKWRAIMSNNVEDDSLGYWGLIQEQLIIGLQTKFITLKKFIENANLELNQFKTQSFINQFQSLSNELYDKIHIILAFEEILGETTNFQTINKLFLQIDEQIKRDVFLLIKDEMLQSNQTDWLIQQGQKYEYIDQKLYFKYMVRADFEIGWYMKSEIFYFIDKTNRGRISLDQFEAFLELENEKQLESYNKKFWTQEEQEIDFNKKQKKEKKVTINYTLKEVKQILKQTNLEDIHTFDQLIKLIKNQSYCNEQLINFLQQLDGNKTSLYYLINQAELIKKEMSLICEKQQFTKSFLENSQFKTVMEYTQFKPFIQKIFHVKEDEIIEYIWNLFKSKEFDVVELNILNKQINSQHRQTQEQKVFKQIYTLKINGIQDLRETKKFVNINRLQKVIKTNPKSIKEIESFIFGNKEMYFDNCYFQELIESDQQINSLKIKIEKILQKINKLCQEKNLKFSIIFKDSSKGYSNNFINKQNFFDVFSEKLDLEDDKNLGILYKYFQSSNELMDIEQLNKMYFDVNGTEKQEQNKSQKSKKNETQDSSNDFDDISEERGLSDLSNDTTSFKDDFEEEIKQQVSSNSNKNTEEPKLMNKSEQKQIENDNTPQIVVNKVKNKSPKKEQDNLQQTPSKTQWIKSKEFKSTTKSKTLIEKENSEQLSVSRNLCSKPTKSQNFSEIESLIFKQLQQQGINRSHLQKIFDPDYKRKIDFQKFKTKFSTMIDVKEEDQSHYYENFLNQANEIKFSELIQTLYSNEDKKQDFLTNQIHEIFDQFKNQNEKISFAVVFDILSCFGYFLTREEVLDKMKELSKDKQYLTFSEFFSLSNHYINYKFPIEYLQTKAKNHFNNFLPEGMNYYTFYQFIQQICNSKLQDEEIETLYSEIKEYQVLDFDKIWEIISLKKPSFELEKIQNKIKIASMCRLPFLVNLFKSLPQSCRWSYIVQQQIIQNCNYTTNLLKPILIPCELDPSQPFLIKQYQVQDSPNIFELVFNKIQGEILLQNQQIDIQGFHLKLALLKDNHIVTNICLVEGMIQKAKQKLIYSLPKKSVFIKPQNLEDTKLYIELHLTIIGENQELPIMCGWTFWNLNMNDVRKDLLVLPLIFDRHPLQTWSYPSNQKKGICGSSYNQSIKIQVNRFSKIQQIYQPMNLKFLPENILINGDHLNFIRGQFIYIASKILNSNQQQELYDYQEDFVKDTFVFLMNDFFLSKNIINFWNNQVQPKLSKAAQVQQISLIVQKLIEKMYSEIYFLINDSKYQYGENWRIFPENIFVQSQREQISKKNFSQMNNTSMKVLDDNMNMIDRRLSMDRVLKLINFKFYEKIIMEINLNELEIDLFSKLKENFKKQNVSEVYIAGGWVRDKLFGQESLDFDIVGHKEDIPKIINAIKQTQVGIFYTSKECFDFKNKPQTSYINESSFEIKQPPLQGYIVNVLHMQFKHGREIISYKLDLRQFFNDSLEDDAKTRDFKLNAIYYNIVKSQVVDVIGGMDDIMNQEISLCDLPEKVFSDSFSRYFRLLRFKLKLDFEISQDIIDFLNKANFKEIAKKINFTDFSLLKDIKKSFYDDNNVEILEECQKYNIHYLILNTLSDQEFNLLWKEQIELLRKLRTFLKNEKVIKFLQVYFQSKQLSKFIEGIYLFSLPFLCQILGFNQSAIFYISIITNHLQDNRIVVKEVELIEDFKSEIQDSYTDFDNLLDLIQRYINLKGKEFRYSLISLIYKLTNEKLLDFIPFFIENYEKKYFEYKFESLNIQDISSDDDTKQLQFNELFIK